MPRGCRCSLDIGDHQSAREEQQRFSGLAATGSRGWAADASYLRERRRQWMRSQKQVEKRRRFHRSMVIAFVQAMRLCQETGRHHAFDDAPDCSVHRRRIPYNIWRSARPAAVPCAIVRNRRAARATEPVRLSENRRRRRDIDMPGEALPRSIANRSPPTAARVGREAGRWLALRHRCRR